jgi:hypothetical protein
MSVVDVIPIGSLSFAGPNWLAAGAGSIWTDVPNINAVVRIDPTTDTVLATIPDKGACGALAASATAVWIAGSGGPGCPNSNTVTGKLNAGGQTDSLALDDNTLWYGTSINNFLGLRRHKQQHDRRPAQTALRRLRPHRRLRIRLGDRPRRRTLAQSPTELTRSDPTVAATSDRRHLANVHGTIAAGTGEWRTLSSRVAVGH